MFSDRQKLFRYFYGTEIATLSRTPLSPAAAVFPSNLTLCLKDLKSLISAISALKFVASSLEQNH